MSDRGMAAERPTKDEMETTGHLIHGSVVVLQIMQMDADTPCHLRNALFLLETSLARCADTIAEFCEPAVPAD